MLPASRRTVSSSRISATASISSSSRDRRPLGTPARTAMRRHSIARTMLDILSGQRDRTRSKPGVPAPADAEFQERGRIHVDGKEAHSRSARVGLKCLPEAPSLRGGDLDRGRQRERCAIPRRGNRPAIRDQPVQKRRGRGAWNQHGDDLAAVGHVEPLACHDAFRVHAEVLPQLTHPDARPGAGARDG